MDSSTASAMSTKLANLPCRYLRTALKYARHIIWTVGLDLSWREATTLSLRGKRSLARASKRSRVRFARTRVSEEGEKRS